ncbi:MAG TPA: magnesium transporter CorA family protein [Solirubrobacteraceae bacterium]
MEVVTAADRDSLVAMRDEGEFFWLDLRDPSDADLKVLGEVLGLHPLALEDTREWRQRPKVEPYPDHVFMVFYTVAAAVGGSPSRSMEIHLYISGQFIVTARRGDCAEVDLLRGRLEKDRSDEPEDYLVYLLLDGLTDAYYPLIEQTEDRIDALEAEVLNRPQRAHLERIYRLKQEVHGFERRVVAQRDYFPSAVDAVMGLSGLSKGTRAYLRDVADHLNQVAGELARQAGDLSALTDTFFNANANKLNQAVTRLSLVSTYFVVGALITGFFGQNFGWLVDHIDSFEAFMVFGVGGLVVPMGALTLYVWRRRDDWR